MAAASSVSPRAGCGSVPSSWSKRGGQVRQPAREDGPRRHDVLAAEEPDPGILQPAGGILEVGRPPVRVGQELDEDVEIGGHD